MVQKSDRKRGRPRAYDPDTALSRAMAAFWDGGYAATSLDDLRLATGMNRPSLYGAFGDKRAIYRKAFASYREFGQAALREALAYDRPLRQSLHRVYDKALSIYLAGDSGARGCFLIATGLPEAVSDVELRAALSDALAEFDEAFEARFRFAQAQGELTATIDPAGLAKLASAVLHFLAVRSRAGQPRAALEPAVEAWLDLIGGLQKIANGGARPYPGLE